MNSIKEKVDRLVYEGYAFDFNAYVRDGFRIFRSNALAFISFASLNLLAVLLLSLLGNPYVFYGAQVLIQPVFLVCYCLTAHRVCSGETVRYSDFFRGFKFFVPVLLITLAEGLMILAGTLALVVPGFYLMVAFKFAYLFKVFFNTSLADSLRFSQQIIHREWFNFFGLVLVLELSTLVVGQFFPLLVIITIPLSACISYAVFRSLLLAEDKLGLQNQA